MQWLDYPLALSSLRLEAAVAGIRLLTLDYGLVP